MKLSSLSWMLLQVCELILLTWSAGARPHPRLFNVMDFGAVADGKTDSSKAITSAWNKACAWGGVTRVLIPSGVYLAGPITFAGPCRGFMDVHINGVVKASTDLALFRDTWILFAHVGGLVIGGQGILHGQGEKAWPYNDCSKNPHCRSLPATVRFEFVTDGAIDKLHSVDSKNIHIGIFGSERMNLRNITITAPEDSPNTDGIQIGSSSFINIQNSNIGTGDDCIALSHGTNNIYVENVTCGPGHGISVGSLGGSHGEKPVEGLRVKNCTFIGTQNGVRIKTWSRSYPNLVRNMTFEHIKMQDVYNPIVIDQEYCPHNKCDLRYSSNVEIKDIHYANIWGISMSDLAVSLVCSKTVPCKQIELRNIDLSHKERGISVSANCSNAQGFSSGILIPPSCLW